MKNIVTRTLALLLGILLAAVLPAQVFADSVAIGPTMTLDVALAVIDANGNISRIAADPVSEEVLSQGEYLSLCVKFQNTGDMDISLEGYSLLIDNEEVHAWGSGSKVPAGGSSALIFNADRMSSYNVGEHAYWVYKAGECDTVGTFTLPDVTWTCPACGKSRTTAFCPDDGTKRPSAENNETSSYISDGVFNLTPQEFCDLVNSALLFIADKASLDGPYTAELGADSEGNLACRFYCAGDCIGFAYMIDSNMNYVSEDAGSFYDVFAYSCESYEEKPDTNLALISCAVHLALDPKLEHDESGLESLVEVLSTAITDGESELNGIRVTYDSENYIVYWFAQ